MRLNQLVTALPTKQISLWAVRAMLWAVRAMLIYSLCGGNSCLEDQCCSNTNDASLLSLFLNSVFHREYYLNLPMMMMSFVCLFSLCLLLCIMTMTLFLQPSNNNNFSFD
eukprot:gene8570-6011_t